MPFLSEDEVGQVQQAPQLEFTGTTGRSAKNNNPFNIEFRPWMTEKYGAVPEPTHGGRFAKYPDMQIGYQAGLDIIKSNAQEGHTLASFVNKFSPSFENPTTQLVADYGNAIGAGPETPLAQIPPEQLAVPMLARESSTKIVGGGQTKGQFFSESDINPQSTPTTPVPPAGESSSGMAPDTFAMGQGGIQSIPEMVGQALQPQEPNTFIPGTSESLNMFSPGSMDFKGMFGGQNMLNQLPLAGMMAGGVTGGLVSSPLGGFAAPVGAGLGAGAGEALKQYLGGSQSGPGQQAIDVGKQMATGATAEMGGSALGKLAEPLFAPFAKRVAGRMAANPSVAEAQKLVEAGAPISPSQIADTKTSRFFEFLADKVWPASSIMANKRKSLQGVAEGLKDEFVTSRGLYDTSKGGVSKAWDDWIAKAGGPETIYPMPNAKAAVDEAIKKPFAQMGAFWKKHAATFADEVANNQVTVQGIRDLFNTLNPMAAKGAERTARMKIADAVMEDLAKVGDPEVVKALGIAREMTFLNRVAGPLRAIFNQSKIEPTTAGDVVQFNPSKFVNLWNQKRGNFLENRNYSPEDIKVIDKFADQMRAMIPDLSKGAKFTPSTSLGGVTQFNLENPVAVSAGVIKQPLLAVPVGLDAWLANSLMSPTGMMRKFLTTGTKPPTLPIKIGIMEGMKND